MLDGEMIIDQDGDALCFDVLSRSHFVGHRGEDIGDILSQALDLGVLLDNTERLYNRL